MENVADLIAYIPVPNRFYLNWLERHRNKRLFLVNQALAQSLIPALARNMAALDAPDVARALLGLGVRSQVSVFHPGVQLVLSDAIMPDEDLSQLFAERYLKGCKVEYEVVWGRWDMKMVIAQQPVIPDLEISCAEIDQLRMAAAEKMGRKSPDWWRQIGALAVQDGQINAVAYNEHYPDQYETMIFGDPRSNFNAGEQPEVYLSRHAERGLITGCARRKDVSLDGAEVYVKEFPCGNCARDLADVGIKKLFFRNGYSVIKGLETLRAAGIQIVQVKCPESV